MTKIVYQFQIEEEENEEPERVPCDNACCSVCEFLECDLRHDGLCTPSFGCNDIYDHCVFMCDQKCDAFRGPEEPEPEPPEWPDIHPNQGTLEKYLKAIA